MTITFHVVRYKINESEKCGFCLLVLCNKVMFPVLL
jgi:hypothetical protein